MKNTPDETLARYARLSVVLHWRRITQRHGARALIEDESNEKFFSVASLWEIAIKVSIGKLILSAPFDEIFPDQLTNNGIDLLGITPSHVSPLTTLLFHHRDPFDRLLIAQAMIDQMQIVSIDRAFDNYSVTRLW